MLQEQAQIEFGNRNIITITVKGTIAIAALCHCSLNRNSSITQLDNWSIQTTSNLYQKSLNPLNISKHTQSEKPLWCHFEEWGIIIMRSLKLHVLCFCCSDLTSNSLMTGIWPPFSDVYFLSNVSSILNGYVSSFSHFSLYIEHKRLEIQHLLQQLLTFSHCSSEWFLLQGML